MSQNHELNRRAFLRGAGATAVLGAVGVRSASATRPSALRSAPLYPTYDFDEVFDRVGTDCSKLGQPDREVRRGHRGRDGDRRHGLPNGAVCHQSPCRALRARKLGLSEEARVVRPVDRGLEQATLRPGRRSQHHRSERRRPRGHHRWTTNVRAAWVSGTHDHPDLQWVL